LTVLPQFQNQQSLVPAGAGAGPGSSVTGGPNAVVGPSGAGNTTAVNPGGGPSSGASGHNPIAAPPGLTCAPGKNGGQTDVGVSADSINLASTLAESGVGGSFLGDAQYGILAVINQVNRAGGICGRQLKWTYADDGWSPQTGEQDIRNFINQNTFALAVVPSSEGLNNAANNGDIDGAPDPVLGTKGIPVVGTDGMLYSQYTDPWIWPVASSTISTAHIAASQAYHAGARTFGVVYDQNYKFGKEGEAAFKGAVSRLGGQLLADVPVQAGAQSYGSQVQSFESGCHPCDTTLMLLEPDTALAWIKSDQSSNHYIFGGKETEGPQSLFVSSFGSQCGQLCNNMWVWSGFQAPFPPFDSQASTTSYVNAIRSVSNSADTANQFLEGSYAGMQLLVQAIKDISPYVTRARLQQDLNQLTFNDGLSEPLHWSSGNHFANTSMLGFTIQYSGGFNGFQYQQTGWLKDPWSNLDHPS
jgi:ABC-type branched-subunit amino acid transport system substrate-binding protein